MRCFHFAASILSPLRKPKETNFNDANSSFDFAVIEPLFAKEKNGNELTRLRVLVSSENCWRRFCSCKTGLLLSKK